MILLAYNHQKPSKVKATAIGSPDQEIDVALNVSMIFGQDSLAIFSTDLRVDLANTAVISGTEGTVFVSIFS